MSRVLVGILLACALAPVTSAQWTKAMNQRGFVPGASFDGSSLDSINMVNGNIVLSVPITSLPAGPAGSGLDLSLIYNSALYDVTGDFPYTPFQYQTLRRDLLKVSDTQGWSYGFNYGLLLENRIAPNGGGCNYDFVNQHNVTSVTPQESVYQYRLRAIFPDGSLHVLYLHPKHAPVNSFWTTGIEDTNEGGGWFSYHPGGGITSCLSNDAYAVPKTIPGDLTYYTRDGTYMRVVLSGCSSAPCAWDLRPWTMYFPDGRRVTGKAGQTESIVDKNNNTITISHAQHCFTPVSNSNPLTLIRDSFGRCIQIEFAGGQDYITQTGANGNPLQWVVTTAWTVADFTYPCYVADQLNGGGPMQGSCSIGGLYGGSYVYIPIVSQISLPGFTTSLSYNFTYASSKAVLEQITLPYGATIHYDYTGNPNAIDNLANYWVPYLKTRTHHDPDTGQQLQETWSYQIDANAPNGGMNQVTNPDGGVFRHRFNPPYNSIYGGPAGHTYRIEEPDGGRVEQMWGYNSPVGCYGNPVLKAEIRAVAQAGTPLGGTPTVAAAKTYLYDLNGNVQQTDQYDWASYSASFTHGGGTDGPVTAPLNIPFGATRTTVNVYNTSAASGNADCRSGTPGSNEYWQPSAPQLLTAADSTTIKSGSTPVAYSTFEYDNPLTTGNLRKEWRWDDSKAAWSATLSDSNAIKFEKFYNGSGDVTDEIDPNGVTTHFVYGNSTHPYATEMFEAYGQPEQRHWTFFWDSNSGLRTSETDADNGLTTTAIYDIRGRVKEIHQAGQRETRNDYNDGNRTLTVYSDLNNYTDGVLSTTTTMDDLGQPWKVHNNNTGVETRQFERVVSGATYQLASNPFISTSESTMGWTRTQLDPKGRVIEVKHFTGVTKPTPWSGSDPANTGAATTAYNTLTTSWAAETQSVTDEAGANRTLIQDGLGRLHYAIEAGSLTTTYAYDLLDNLTGVNQSGQLRSFTYSSLQRLTSATHPESGTVSYKYDNNGNMVKRTDARSVITCYGLLSGSTCDSSSFQGYNRLNQPKRIQYSDGTPVVTYTYGGCTLGIGRLCSVANSNSSSSYGYDALGRIASSTQNTSGVPYPFSYQYKKNDALSQITYPSQRQVTYTFDTAGRVQSVSGVKSGQTTNYTDAATPITYTAHGAIASMILGARTEQHCYNARLQPIAIRVGSALTTDCANPGADLLNLSYGFDATNNNGNIKSQTVQRPGQNVTQQYIYDGVNRLKMAAENPSTNISSLQNPTCTQFTSNWCQGFGYDAQGNRWLPSYSGLAPGSDVPQTQNAYVNNNNRINGWDYDAAGNLHEITVQNGFVRQATYDAENRMKWMTLANGDQASYDYDGEGRRVKKTVTPAGQSAIATVFVYDAQGNLAAEYGTTNDIGTRYLTADHLGSTRLIMKTDGSVDKNYDYLPFGEEVGGVYPHPGGSNTLEFTSKERDAETGLDYFGARYMSSAQGRFTSADPTSLNFLRVVNPQRWNMYGYAVNNPLKYLDADGEEAIAVVYPGYEVGIRNQTSSGPVSANLGHAGVVLVAGDGSTHYFEYGRYNGPQDVGPPGLVQHAGRDNAPTPALTRDASGKITPDSMKALLGTLSTAAGKGGAVAAVVLSTNDSEYAAMEAYLNQRMDQNTNPNRQPYSISGGHNCGTLVCETLSAAGRRSPQGLGGAPPRAIFQVFLRSPFDFGVTQSFSYQPPKEEVKSKICFINEKGKKVCQ